jgi:hypothetical protein
MQILTAAPYLCNPEVDRSKLTNMFSKMYLQSGCNLADIASLVPEKFDDYSLIMVYPKRIFNRFSAPDREDHLFKSDTVESNLIYSTFRRVQTVEICQSERRTPQPSWGDWRMYLSTR